jgi:hypothetical protein
MVELDFLEMNTSINKISLCAAGGDNFAVETSPGGRTRNARDAETGMLRAKELPAVGLASPFSVRLSPLTQADEGDPPKVLLMDPIGSLQRCRVLAGTAAEESSVEPPNTITQGQLRSCCARIKHYMRSPTCR